MCDECVMSVGLPDEVVPWVVREEDRIMGQCGKCGEPFSKYLSGVLEIPIDVEDRMAVRARLGLPDYFLKVGGFKDTRPVAGEDGKREDGTFRPEVVVSSVYARETDSEGEDKKLGAVSDNVGRKGRKRGQKEGRKKKGKGGRGRKRAKVSDEEYKPGESSGDESYDCPSESSLLEL